MRITTRLIVSLLLAVGVVAAAFAFREAAHSHAPWREVWRHFFPRLLAQMVVVAAVTLIVLRWNVMRPIAQLAEWMKRLRAGEPFEGVRLPREDVLAPLVREAGAFAQHLSRARTAAEEEARLRRESETLWTADKLKEMLRNKLGGKPLIVVSNREPYMHVHRGRRVECVIPAGGLVAALDPVLRASGGLWIAHGAGDADGDTVDDKGRVRVPPQDPRYTLKRVSLTPEEEDGYYYGFSNEGLWPLCHIAHARPVFRPLDWEHYKEVNARFAESLLEEIEGMKEPLVLLQDYHFALLPRLVKDRRPDARIALFWHIPWPNPEAFAICPWQKEILYGLLGADLLGFQTQFHVNNFLNTVDRTLECRIDWDRFTVMKSGRPTLVKPFPISVEFSESAEAAPAKAALFKELGVAAEIMALGVDRVDYTKGLLERFQAVERFLEKYPAFRGRFTLVQIGAPSRTHIKRYHEFMAEVEREADRINWRFRARNWRPIVFVKRHHEAPEIRPYYRRADLCLVTSLHDGMNLVAKEYVAARADGDGALVLSRFAGAAGELREAVMVNPYDADATAEAIHTAVEMPEEERRLRMARMRATVRENNVFHWAGNLILELTQLAPAMAEARP